MEECIRYTVFDSEVPSVAAQRAWQAEWARRMGEPQLPGQAARPGGDGAAARERMHRNLQARADVLALWQEWYSRQGS